MKLCRWCGGRFEHGLMIGLLPGDYAHPKCVEEYTNMGEAMMRTDYEEEYEKLTTIHFKVIRDLEELYNKITRVSS